MTSNRRSGSSRKAENAGDEPSRPGTRQANKQRTREELIRATIRVLHQHGPKALTTGRIADEAGVAQPTFYVHFEGMEDALTQAADEVASKLLEHLRESRRNLTYDSSAESLRDTFQSSVNAFLADPQMTELFLRHRRDVESPLGRRFREITDRGRQDLVEDLRAMGLDETVLLDPQVHAELLVGMVFTVVEGLLDGRLADKSSCIEGLVHMASSSMAAALEQASSS